ncbi:MAG: TlyA family RNA methyltransferase [Gloeomargarita sp. GMQP_bins_120]
MKERLDTLLVAQGHFPTREQARRAIQAGWVQVNHQVVDKPGAWVAVDSQITVQSRSPYVSRGGEKLAHALRAFHIQVTDRVALDGGISSGGFTDCLLQAGARRVYGVDVGYGQVAWSLRQDPRVKVLERTNLRYLRPEQLYAPGDPWPDLGVLDLSFISVTKVLPAVWDLLLPPRELVILVKPQFEVGRQQVGKGGVVRSPQAQAQAIQTVAQAAMTLGWQVHGLTASPLLGPAGNREFLLWLRLDHPPAPLDWPVHLQRVVTEDSRSGGDRH